MKPTRWWQCTGGCRRTAEDTQVCRKRPRGVLWGHFLLRDLSVYRIWRTTAGMQEVVQTFSPRMRNAVAAGSDYGGLHFGSSSWDWDNQPKHWMSEQGAAVVVAAEERPRILEWLFLARRVTLGGYWTSGVGLVSGWTAWSAGPWSPFPIIPHPKSQVGDKG